MAVKPIFASVLKRCSGVLNTSSRQGLNAELTRYTLSLMVLERKLAASKGAMDTLGNRIAGLHRQLEHFDLQSETLLSAMAGIYVDDEARWGRVFR